MRVHGVTLRDRRTRKAGAAPRVPIATAMIVWQGMELRGACDVHVTRRRNG
jgi:hypothetical protein